MSSAASQGLEITSVWWWSGKPTVSMRAQVSFQPPEVVHWWAGRSTALLQPSWGTWVTFGLLPLLTPIVLAVRALISGLVHGQFWSAQQRLTFTISKPDCSVLPKLDEHEFWLLALPSTPHFLNTHMHCKCSQENVCSVEALNSGCVGKLLIVYIKSGNSLNGGGGTWWKIAA